MTMITTIKMQIELKKIAEPQQLEYIRELYISAFPAKERRELRLKKEKYDPSNISKKAKPGKPGIYLE